MPSSLTPLACISLSAGGESTRVAELTHWFVWLTRWCMVPGMAYPQILPPGILLPDTICKTSHERNLGLLMKRVGTAEQRKPLNVELGGFHGHG